MADPPDIPGFYYDKEKKRYFKVLPTHKAGQENNYSKDAVKRRKVEAHVKEQEEAQHNAPKPTRRLNTSLHSLASSSLSREITGSAVRDSAPKIWSKCLEKSTKDYELSSAYAGDGITVMDADASGGKLYMGSARGLFGSTAISSKDYQTSYLGHFSSPVTSLNVSQSGNTIICTSLGNERGLAALQVWKNAPRDPAEQGVSAGETGLGLSVVFTPTNKGSLWTSTISKHDENTYAIGGTRLLMIARHTFDSGADTRRAQHKFPVWSDVFSTMFLGPDVLAAGCRDGTVQLFDTRVREAGVMKLRHGSSVTHMRNVQDHCLVVNGLQGSLEMYDLRTPRPHAPSASFGRQTDPVVSYKGHKNSHTFQLGFDVDAALGVVAAAGDDGSVRLWSLYTGTSLDATKLNRGRKPTQIQTSRFFRTAEQEDTRLLIATRDIVESWGC